MAKKLVTKMEDLRRMRSEGPEAWESRQLVASAFLDARSDYPNCKFRLKQVQGDPETGQIPDFTLECAGGKRWAIEIGITGSKRVGELENVGFEVIKVGRGRGLDFDKKIRPAHLCPKKRCPHK